MSIDEKTVRHVANLSRLDLADVDVGELTAQMKAIINYMEQLKEPDVTGVPATAHARPQPLPLREDEPLPGLSKEEALAGAPARKGDFILVPTTIEDGGST